MLTLLPALLTVSLLASEPNDPLEPVLPEGHRAYSIKFDALAFPGFVLPGSKVDVVLTEKKKNGKTKSSVVVKDRLLVVVDFLNDDQRAGTATIAVKPEDAKILADADKKGKLSLVLRPIDDAHKAQETLSEDRCPPWPLR